MLVCLAAKRGLFGHGPLITIKPFLPSPWALGSRADTTPSAFIVAGYFVFETAASSLRPPRGYLPIENRAVRHALHPLNLIRLDPALDPGDHEVRPSHDISRA